MVSLSAGSGSDYQVGARADVVGGEEADLVGHPGRPLRAVLLAVARQAAFETGGVVGLDEDQGRDPLRPRGPAGTDALEDEQRRRSNDVLLRRRAALPVVAAVATGAVLGQ